MQPSLNKRAHTPDTDPKPNCLQNNSRVSWHYTLELIQKQFQSVGVSVMFPLMNAKIMGVRPKERRRHRAEKRSSKRVFLEFSAPLRFATKTSENLKGAEKKWTLQNALFRRRTNVQQLTCNIDLSRSFYYLFFSFVLLELKPFVLKGKVLGEKL